MPASTGTNARGKTSNSAKGRSGKGNGKAATSDSEAAMDVDEAPKSTTKAKARGRSMQESESEIEVQEVDVDAQRPRKRSKRALADESEAGTEDEGQSGNGSSLSTKRMSLFFPLLPRLAVLTDATSFTQVLALRRPPDRPNRHPSPLSLHRQRNLLLTTHLATSPRSSRTMKIFCRLSVPLLVLQILVYVAYKKIPWMSQ